ncbi:leucine-rich repeats and immunoglobulin-like domains protein 3 isoform X1 [Varroa jacobsoni]|uniref:leucine-rich repeats and immunoglobulin-like domains protein 3 isoform X1 n=1 Tax=Varroa jacobsoni TaxID=62625 RepID=UPI000BF9D356|nr:leucine-rich repeats and immunoglobulin-like domains protein 3 isoform X1 [Varroa jacobsoni]
MEERTLIRWSLINIWILWHRAECQVPPQISPFKVLEDLSEGKRLSLLCSVASGTPPFSFTWSKNGRPIDSRSDVKIAHYHDFQEQLQIEKLTAEHVANYTCTVTNSLGSDQISVAVALKFKPRWKNVNENQTLTAVAGEKARLDCEAVGHPLPVVKIHKDGTRIDDSHVRDGIFSINAVSFGNKGDYNCEASNSLGRISKTITLHLSGNELAKLCARQYTFIADGSELTNKCLQN